jgi:transcriptional regulator with GAF, ATPase, and Fis domain
VIDTIPSETMQALVRYHWPGNIRELQNVIERAVIGAGEEWLDRAVVISPSLLSVQGESASSMMPQILQIQGLQYELSCYYIALKDGMPKSMPRIDISQERLHVDDDLIVLLLQQTPCVSCWAVEKAVPELLLESSVGHQSNTDQSKSRESTDCCLTGDGQGLT